MVTAEGATSHAPCSHFASASRHEGKALFATIAKKLGDNPGLRPQDVFINLVEVAKENWSFGHGIAQYA
jgi:4-oxalocrotonate tautomerase